MNNKELNDRLHQIFDTCALHWIELRKVRNDIAHEYPASITERIEGLNILFDNLEVLKKIIEKCHSVFKEYK